MFVEFFYHCLVTKPLGVAMHYRYVERNCLENAFRHVAIACNQYSRLAFVPFFVVQLPACTYFHAISQVNFKVHHVETACAGNFYRALNIQRYRVNICFSKFRRFYGNFYISSRNFRRVETFEESIIQMQDFILSVAFGQSLYVYNAAVHIHGIALFFFVANPVNRADLFPFLLPQGRPQPKSAANLLLFSRIIKNKT